MSLFDISERYVLDLVFGSGTPASYEIGLLLAAPTEGGSLSEVTGVGYSRVVISNNVGMFPAATTLAGVTKKKNAAAIVFPTAGGAWGTVTHWFLYDPVGTRLMNWGALTPNRAISNGDILRINVNQMEISLD